MAVGGRREPNIFFFPSATGNIICKENVFQNKGRNFVPISFVLYEENTNCSLCPPNVWGLVW